MGGDVKSLLLPIAGVAATVATGGAAAPLVAGGLASSGTLATLATVASIGSSLYGAYSGFQAGRNEAAQYKQQVEMESIRAQQEEANRRIRLNEILGAQMAATAGRGVVVGSGSDIAIADFSIEEANRESQIAKTDSLFKQSQLRSQSSQARKAGTASLISGIGNAVSTGYDDYTRRKERERTQ